MNKKSFFMLIVMVTVILSGCGKAAAVETVVPAEEEAFREEEAESEATKETSVVSDNLITVGVVNSSPEESGYRLAIDTELKNVFTAENGYSASFAYKEESGEQITAAKQFIADSVDYLLLSANDTADWGPVLTDAHNAGVRVILFDRIINVDENLYEAAVISDPEQEGEDAVGWIKSQDLSEYNIIHLQDATGTETQKAYTNALNKQLMNSEWKIVAQQMADCDSGQAQKIVQAVIDSGESFNVIYAESDDIAKDAVAALDAADISHGVNGHVIVVSFGCNKWALEELLAQNWNYEGQRSFLQAFYIDKAIMTMESGGKLADKIIVMDETGFDATTITAEDIMIYGIS